MTKHQNPTKVLSFLNDILIKARTEPTYCVYYVKMILGFTDKVNVSSPTKGSYSYDPGDDYPTKSEVGMILGLSYYFEKVKISSGFNLYESGAAFKYGISYRF